MKKFILIYSLVYLFFCFPDFTNKYFEKHVDIKQLCIILNKIYPGKEFNSVEELNSHLQKEFLRMQGKERWEVDKWEKYYQENSYDAYDAIDDAKSVIKTTQIDDYSIKTAKTFIILGATFKSMLKRTLFLLSILQYFNIDLTTISIFIVCGQRTLDSKKESEKTICNTLSKYNISFEIEEVRRLTNEIDCAHYLANIFKKKYNIKVFCQEKLEPGQKRATTDTTMKNFFSSNLSGISKKEKMIAISDPMYDTYQDIVIKNILTSMKLDNKICHVISVNTEFHNKAPRFGIRLFNQYFPFYKDKDLKIDTLYDLIARIVYSLHISSKNKHE